MPFKKEKKTEIIQKFQQGENDTGSSEVQVALLTERITTLVEHLRTNTKDNHSRRGLLILVSQRKKLLSYLQGTNAERHKNLVADLGLRA